MKFSKKLLFSAIILSFVVPAPVQAAVTSQKQAEKVEQNVQSTMPTKQRVSDLTNTAIYYYWNGGQLKKNEKKIFKGVTIKSNFGIMEHLFKQAIKLDPQDTNLQMDLASTYRMEDKNSKANDIWKNILKVHPKNYNARLKLAAFAHANGDDQTYNENISQLEAQNPTKTATFTDAIHQADNIQNLDINTKVPSNLPKDSHHYFVVLGYALGKDGKMQKTMLDRLNVTLKAAKKYPKSKIMVSGGVPQDGVTEAAAMQKWLVSKGINKNRIEKEDLSTNTVENALFSIRDLNNDKATSATLITSASHMRRAYLLFNMAEVIVENSATTDAKQPTMTQIASVDDKKVLHKVESAEKNAIMDDVLRINGVWQLPGLQR
ncbi:ElyC/SanA/YdcF family protein [Companilactobacillus sp.]|jgi:vancomycin permeability regulator SanA|uniref:ElyC/SanA/YdcF family protein n=1 Tax=Companilactobacillus sp. TaxID=2767905 RepID=UPI0025BFD3B7|nr:ElyC/SanA/YdcF family protein [Companilactobacillus sp.]MCH4009117.1 YdcF family protein [Companilactobacillus sp.]MCH4050704.1 YdcF family protein [Companilactobacillus sp.]MCH4077059.1 YdcF family protein [Companilactobacillus sp.]MCH4125635.1 YdcF family protein [Companilactobacillus sp.]MCI1311344.1 YdcF family protein [Companilactobacillus sp.]